MSFSFYDVSMGVNRSCLTSLRTLVEKAQKEPNADKLVDARIHDDMLPFHFQVHMVTDFCSKYYARVTGTEPEAYDRHNFRTYDQFYERISQVEAKLAKLDRDFVNGREDATVTFGMGVGKSMDLKMSQYFLAYAQPNLLFHLTTAYDILRKEGLSLTKSDYSGAFFATFGSS